jgi:branched-subunit amino acid ABC-type transport system permease component
MMTGLAAALLAGFDRLSVAVTGSAAVGAMTAVAGSLDAVASVPGLVESIALILVVVLVVARPSATLEPAGART